MSNTTLDDTSPFITYGGDTWGTNHTNDALLPKYFDATFHSTTVAGAWARFCWNGTDITLFGARRNNHALYAVTVDNGPVVWFNGFSGPDQLQAPLFASAGLEQEKHQITIFNENNVNATKELIWLDVDYINFIGDAIDCAEVENNTVIPSGTIAPPAGMTESAITSAISSTITSSSSYDIASSSDVESSSSLSSSSEISSSSSSEVSSTISSSIAAPTTLSISSSSTSTSARARTTVIMDQPNVSTNAASSTAEIAGAQGTASSSGAALSARMELGIGQVALIGVMGWYFGRFVR
ncbi:hypothetical protein L198_04843 [Cryptococcus wingfieldii CBS 7118]|uniref:Uncharacterized protein n=1 Tax=Cryptococcus wingfieldii CBS 7118 TaxID=1295528 RepID=A0A1E3J1J5_9TREE|nr:hypothetical protein L198_04843 [Cryptococcus wingfieldii CBS 7118]ODN94702.1 hypothetical protein L198_04843 [Cryptococcus wingfieldii CBS 7118]